MEPHAERRRTEERVGKIAGADTDQVLAAYRQAYPKMNPAELLITITTASNFWVRSVILAERKAAQGKAPVFMYSFNWERRCLTANCGRHMRSTYPSSSTRRTSSTTTTIRRRCRDRGGRSATWASFARAGVPDNKAIPHWPPILHQSRATMMINAEWEVENDPAREARLMWKKIALA